MKTAATWTQQDEEQLLSRIRKRSEQLQQQKADIDAELNALQTLLTRYVPDARKSPKQPGKPVQRSQPSPAAGEGTKYEQVVEIAIRLIKSAGKPCHTSDVMKKANAEGITAASVYTYLSGEVNRTTGARLKKVGRGYYDIANLKRGGMSAEEFDAKVAEAKQKEKVQP